MRAMLMRTCLADAIAPSVSRAAATVLERVGVEVVIPRRADLLRAARVELGASRAGAPGGAAGAEGLPRGGPGGGAVRVVRRDGASTATRICSRASPEEAEARQMAGRTMELTQFLERHGLSPGPMAPAR